MVFNKGDHVWVETKASGKAVQTVSIGAVIKDIVKDQITVIDDDGHEFALRPGTRLRLMHVSSVGGVDDMISLGDLNEAGILRNLLIRYRRNAIYTYTGRILVAVNPYASLQIYRVEHVQAYRNRRMGELPPHIFAVADNAYNDMRRSGHDQSVIISGESGAGKTESTKLILQFLAAVSGRHSWIEHQVLESNPILEAFGNARTIRNDNSSRFGKYIDIYFNDNGAIEGAKIDQFLLEKSRIVNQAREERNYHAFYCLLEGLPADLKKQFGLESSRHYHYLNQGGPLDLSASTDIVNFPTLQSAMKALAFSDTDCLHIFQLLAALLHLGNLTLSARQERNLDSCTVVIDTEFQQAVRLLQVNADNLSKALTTKNIITRDDLVVTNMSVAQGINIRDALVKGIYGRMFVWIVDKINGAIYKPSLARISNNYNNNKGKSSYKSSYTSIGVLDIFGFENFECNSYEQLCINYANENLQQFFVKHIFKMEQEDYAAESIDWQHISFTDNQETLDFIGVKNCNILALIDEESRFPKGTDITLLNKLISTYSKHPRFIKQKADIVKMFGIEHFAGAVHYKIEGFLEKNRDSFNVDLIELIQTTKSEFLKSLFEKDISMGFETRKRAPTLGLQFKKSLDSLMTILHEREPFFIRCIKPNEFKKAQNFDRDLCLRQLRYSGMMETIRIRKAGYPIRHKFFDFIDRYRLLVSGIPRSNKCKDTREMTKVICKKILDLAGYQIGKTKLFLKDAQDLLLEEMRDKMFTNKAIIIQKTWKRFYMRTQFLKKRAAAIRIETFVRKVICRRKYLKMKKGFSLLQARFRAKIASKKLADLKGFVRNVQRYCRGYLARNRIRRKRAAIIKIQALVRRYIAMKSYKKLREKDKKMKEALQLRQKEEATLKNQMTPDKAMLEAEKRHKMRLDKMRTESAADAQQQQQLSSHKRQRIADAERRRNEPVDESEMIDEIFGSIDGDSLSAGGPRAFQDLESSRIKALTAHESGFPAPLPDYLHHHLDEDVSEFTFSKFAATYFQRDIDPEFMRKELKKPLLFHSSLSDQTSALAVWLAILRFMKDLPEPIGNTSRSRLETDSTPIMTKIYQSLGRHTNREDLMRGAAIAETVNNTPYENNPLLYGRKNIVSLTLKKKSKFTEEVVNHLKGSNESSRATYVKSVLEERPTSNLEKLHFIIGHGILMPTLRDEIYCQICKQLTNNSRRESVSRGLILLTLCIGCFAPTEKFVRTLRNFIQTNFPEYSKFIVSRLQRTFSNGTRNQPPSWLELKAIKHKEPIILAVACMNGSTETIFADSASTAQELCLALSQKIGLKDQFGFSLFIAIFDKVSSIGSCGDHVMDSISQCEQFAKENGLTESKAQWRLFFRKEIFTPWHNPSEDSIATNLIYHQVMRGIKFGEYRCDSDDDIGKLVAYQLFIDNVKDWSEESLSKYLPQIVIGKTKEKRKYWLNLVNKAYQNFIDSQKKKSALSDKLKEEIVNFARIKWPMLFSRFYEAVKFSGPSLETNEIIFTVNWTGVYLVDSRERIHLELSFPEIVSVSSSRTTDFITTKTSRLHGQSLSMSTVKGDTYTFNCANSEDIRDLIIMFLEGLKERSHYVIAVQSFSLSDSSFVSCEKGDLLIIESQDNPSKLSPVGWFYGENFRTREKGDFPADIVYILPVIEFPSQSVLALFSDKNFGDTPDGVRNKNAKTSQHTLEEFSKTYFRTSSNGNRSFSMSIGSHKSENLWEHSRQMLKLPLLKKLLNRDDWIQQAVSCFNAILRYMGDEPTKDYNPPEIVEAIFDPCLKHEILKDEIYCQLVKQITSNPNPQSVQSGWELLWLATGIMVPSSNLHRELLEVFRTAKSPIATECQSRLQKTLKLGQRRFPPHTIEINSVKANKSIHHNIYFPNESVQAFEITSNTKCKDLCQQICNKVGLRDSKGFALFVKSIDKAISMPEGDFFFDFIRQLSDWVKKHRPPRDGQLDFTYQVFFMKKLWTNTIAGFDKVADVIFHYPQEVRKYIYGYHKVGIRDVIILGSLILRSHCSDENKSKTLSHIESLDNLVPQDVLSKYSANELQQKLVDQYNHCEGMSGNEAKIEFLKIISQWDTFGSAFFEVKQSTNLNIPEKILIAINKKGVYLIHTKTKETLDYYPYSSISNWSSGNTYFNMTIGNLIHGKKLLCETPLGYKMDDLLTSYISLMLTTITRNPN